MNTVAEIEALIAKDKPDYTTAYNKAVALAEYMKNAPGDDSNDAYDVATDAYTVEAGSQQALSGGNEGPASLAQDGNAGTHWHTSWSANAVSAGTAWYQFNLNEPTPIDGLRYMARSGSANANGKIKKYKITLTLSDGTTKDVVTNGTFTTTSGVWQKVKFDAVKNVTKVRITALETAGQSAGEVNTYASAAELRVTTVRDVPSTEVKVNKCDLQNLYDDASALTEATYTADTWKVLVAKRDAAKKVLDNENATAYDVALAYQNLKDAIAALEERVDTAKLAGLVADAEKLKESAYTKDSWAAFKKALDAAKAVLNNANATKAAVEEGIVAGGGTIFVNVIPAVTALLADAEDDEKTGVQIVAKALEEPIRQIAANAGLDGSVILEKVRTSGKNGFGFDAYKEEYCDMIASGIVDPAKVTRSALENAASVSGMVLTTESLVADKPQPAAAAAPAGEPGKPAGMY